MSVSRKKAPIHKRRPTEVTSGAAGVVAALLAQILHIKNAETVSEIAILLGLLPGGVTYLVTTLRGE